MLAGVAATGEDEVFSIMSAGIFLLHNPTNESRTLGILSAFLHEMNDS